MFEGDLFRNDGVFGDADTYDDDPALDALRDDCAAGGYVACDILWFEAPFGSDYESFTETCGALSEEVFFGGCKIEFGRIRYRPARPVPCRVRTLRARR